MRFDKSSIAIRERSFGEILDLALWVVRKHVLAFFGLLVLGVAPFAVLNVWLLPLPEMLDVDDSYAFQYLLMQHGLMMTWEAPLATAPLTLYLGQVLFWQKVDRKALFTGVFRGLPQLFLYQVVLRGFFLITFVLWIFWCSSWVFMSEIILLERTPLIGGRRRGAVSTDRRRRILHTHRSGDLFGRAVLGLVCALILIAALTAGILVIVWLLNLADVESYTAEYYAVLTAAWVAAGYLVVVRFLSYLDQRIRNEGWELELLMWAEKARIEEESEVAAPVETVPQNA